MKASIFILRKYGHTDAELLDQLENKGYQVFCSRSLVDIMDVLQNYSLSLIISDTEIHLLEGYQKLKKYLSRHQLPIMYLCSDKNTEFKPPAELCIAGLIKKPLNSIEIFWSIEKYIELNNQLVLKVPKDTRIYESRISTIWLDKDGVLCCVVKPFDQSINHTIEFYEIVKKNIDKKKVSLLIDVTLIYPIDKKNKDYLMEESEKYFSAVAVLSSSVFGRFTAHFFIAFKKSLVPIKLFSDEEAARIWLNKMR